MAKLTPAVIDYESFWSVNHSLTKLNPIEYVMHPETEVISCSLKVGSAPAATVFGEEKIRSLLSRIDWSDKLLIAHNNEGFDSMISAWRFGIKPAMWGCTLAMARPHHAKTCGLSLAKLVEHYDLGKKDASALIATKGKHLKDFTEEELAAMKVYNTADTEQCAALFRKLLPFTSKDEMRLIDMTIRMLVEPQFVTDTELLTRELAAEKQRKSDMLNQLADDLGCPDVGDVGEMLSSSNKFAAFLTSKNVEPPMKPSPSNPEKMTYALAKTDEAFIALQDHSDPLVASAARARLGVKSTILETRIEAFLAASAAAGGKLPVPIKYYGADTTGRWSGAVYNCFTGDHEILTPCGWLRVEDWDARTPIMQWWPDGRATWCSSAGKVEHWHDGALVEIDGPLAKGRFTPDHRVISVRGGSVVERSAQWVAEHTGLDSVPAAGVYIGGDSGITPDQGRMLVATYADGCVTSKGIRWGFTKRRKIERFRKLAADCGLSVHEYDYREDSHFVFTLAKKDTPPWLNKDGFGPALLQYTRSTLNAMVDELPHWDGTPHHVTGNTCFFTSKEDQALWVSTLLHLSGTPARASQRAEDKYDVYARSSPYTSVTGKTVQYSGKVFCPQVESSYVFVRYGGQIHVTGNCQNLPRVSGKPSDCLRNSLRAPEGYKVVVADLSGIELRVNHFLWKVPSSMALFQADPEKADLYKEFASALYNIEKTAVTKDQRQVGKVAHLGLGFGAGAGTFRKVAKLMASIDLTDDESQDVVTQWRSAYAEIARGWKQCHGALQAIATGSAYEIDPWGLCATSSEGIVTPKGIIRYPDLRKEYNDEGKSEWVYGQGRNKARIYAGKVTENIVQHLARCIIADNALAVKKATGLTPALMVHDELVYVVPEDEAEGVLGVVQETMRTPPTWWPELVTWSEGDIADTYGEAK